MLGLALVGLVMSTPQGEAVRTAAPLMTLEELTQRHAALLNRTVRVRGRLASCQPLSCYLTGSDAALPTRTLSFDTAPAFDIVAQRFVGSDVIVTGVVLKDCWPGDPMTCLDRGAQFRPLSIVADTSRFPPAPKLDRKRTSHR